MELVVEQFSPNASFAEGFDRLEYPHEESNLELGFRKASLYPFNYEGSRGSRHA